MHFSVKKANNRILLLDDETEILAFLTVYLTSLNWEITAANTASEALEALKTKPYFLVLVDIAMPQMDGYEFISRLKKMNSPSELSLMTGFGYNPSHTLVKLNRIKKFPCLFKPFDRKKLKAVINNAWQKYHKDL